MQEKPPRKPIIGTKADLAKLIDLCLEKGVAEIHIEGIALTFAPGALARAAARHDVEPDLADADGDEPTKKPDEREHINGEPIDDDLLFASSTPPERDP